MTRTMDRLVKIIQDGPINVLTVRNGHAGNASVYREWSISKDSSIRDVLEKLAAYEETGLEPEEIDHFGDITKMVSLDRLRALAEADRDGRCVIQYEPVNNSYKSEQFGKAEQYLSGLEKLLNEAAEKIEDRCQQWQCISARAETDSDIRKSGAALFAYTECLKLVDSIGQKCAEAESALGKEQQ